MSAGTEGEKKKLNKKLHKLHTINYIMAVLLVVLKIFVQFRFVCAAACQFGCVERIILWTF